MSLPLNSDHFTLLEKVGLPQSLFDSGQLNVSILSAQSGQQLFAPGDQCGAFLILFAGSVRVELTSRSGREVVLYRMSKGETCISTTSSLLTHQCYFTRGFADTDITALALPKQDFNNALALSNRFTTFVLQGYASRSHALMGLIDRVTSRDIEYDLGSLLNDNMQADGMVCMTQEKMAKEIGTVREVISRKLISLEKSGAIKRLRGKILVVDKGALT